MHIRKVIHLKGGNKYKEKRGVGRIRQKDIFSTRHGNYKEKKGTRTREITNNQNDQGNQSNQGEQKERDNHKEGYKKYNSENE